MKIIHVLPLALILPIFIFSTPAYAYVIENIELDKHSLMYGESFQYVITRSQIPSAGGEHVEARFINKSSGTASEWSSIPLEGDRHTKVTSKITGQPFDKKGSYLLEIKYLHPNYGFIGYVDFQITSDATSMPKNPHLLSPNEQLSAGLDIKCKESLILVTKHDGSPACVKYETKTKLIERGWIGEIPEQDPDKIITPEDSDKLINIKKGESFLVKLDSNYSWRIDINNKTVVDSDYSDIRYSGSQGVYRAHNSGQAILTGIGDPQCLLSEPQCASPSILFQLNINVK